MAITQQPSSMTEADISVRVENCLCKLYGTKTRNRRKVPNVSLSQLVYDIRFNPKKLLNQKQLGPKALSELREAFLYVDHSNLLGPPD